jgi:uncharacterized RDD family membrane protein YckC
VQSENPFAKLDNPYASPLVSADVAAVPAAAVVLAPASRGKRFLNLILDNIIIQVLSGVAGFVLGIAYAASRMASGGTITPDDEAMLNIIGFFVGITVAIAYFVMTELLFQRTLAKFITGTRVVTADGGRPSFGQIVGRSFARFIPFEAFSFLGDSQPVGWHDSLSKTRVVNA